MSGHKNNSTPRETNTSSIPVGYSKFSVVKPNTVKPSKNNDRPAPPPKKKKGK